MILLILYAADAVLMMQQELEQAMQRDMELLHEWLNTNVLTLNTAKTCYMKFGRAKHFPDMNISIDRTPITRVRTFRYLGLVLDEQLNFKTHVDHIKNQFRPFIS